VKRVLLVFVFALILGFIFLSRQSNERTTKAVIDPAPVPTNAVSIITTPANRPSAPPGETILLGETILRDYARADLPPENDLMLMSRLMDNSLLLLKSAANRPLSANEDWAGLLRGQNGARERFLPDSHIALDPRGQLVDRWRSPLFFHALGSGRFELRSAGPDRRLWTEDDIHRNSDGSFRRGAGLNAPSLLDAAASPGRLP
jgi:hypothetical protein